MSTMADPVPVARPSRPILGGAMVLRGRSYLEEHQQYRPPHHDGHLGIDSMIEGIAVKASPTRTPSTYRGVPSPKSPPKVIESGLHHSLSHSNCQPPPGEVSNRMIAT